MKTHARVQQGEIVFSSEMAKRFFMQKHEGKSILMEPDEAITAEMRRYFEGCIVPVVYYSSPKSGWESFKEAREAIKLEFLPSKPIQALKGQIMARSVPSTADLSKESFRKFLDAVTHWLLENQMCTEDDLDSENYKLWRDSAPAAGEIYPPLKRMKETYDRVKGDTQPPWRRKPSETNSSQTQKPHKKT